ncbi:MAG: DUF2155 domain-containing protein, partial [Croceibacterium sp.]
MRAVAPIILMLALSACNNEPPAPKPVETEVPKQLAQNSVAAAQAGASIGTPMKDRVATLGLLNKRNNISQDLKMKPGESRRIGNVVVKLEACEKTAPWEYDPEEGAFVQVYVQERPDVNSSLAWHKVFSGWLFKNAPSVNVVEHPVYDVWVKSCAMSFPGEEAPAPTSSAKPSGSPSPA